jgi:inosine-uridine nucleoside N-ribohydrolase
VKSLLSFTESVCSLQTNKQIQKATKLRIASFVHGSDGLGNQNFPPPAGKPVDQSAAAFLVEQSNLYPGQVTVVALGPLTNLALAVELDPSFASKIGQIVILGGAYSVNGNVNPAAEANVSRSCKTQFFHC